MLYGAPVDTSPVTEGVTLFQYQLLLLLSPVLPMHLISKTLKQEFMQLVQFILL